MPFVPPSKPPTNLRTLLSIVGQYAREKGVAPGRVQRWISFSILGGALERVRLYDGGPAFIVKGGVAIERRLDSQTRATKDFDAVFQDKPGDLLPALDQAFAEPYGNFTLRRGGEPEDIGKGTRVIIKLAYLDKSWGTVPLEVSGPEGTAVPPEAIPMIDLTLFGLTGPETLPCLPIRRQIAQKLHAVTAPPADAAKDNPRFRDLFDLCQLHDETPLDSELRAECKQIFRLRDQHGWPPEIVVYPSWEDPYAALAVQANASITDVHTAAEKIRELVARIERLAQKIFANEFGEIPNALKENTDLRDAIYHLVATQPLAGKITEEPERLARFRRIMERLVAREIDIDAAIRMTEQHLPRETSRHRDNNRVFPHGWAERQVRTQYSRFYNQAVMEQMLADGHTHCYVPHSSAEGPDSPCSLHLAGGTHDIRVLYDRLVESYGKGNWDSQPKIPNHPHCTHVVVPSDVPSDS